MDYNVKQETEGFKKGCVEVVESHKKNLTISLTNVKKKNIPKYWNKEYINEMISKMPEGKDKMLCTFLWMTGVRITEALSLRKRDLDLKNYTAEIRHLKSRKYHTRTIPLHPRLRDLLGVYCAALNLDDRLFPISRQHAYEGVVKKWFGGGPHTFRHSFAVHWLRSGGELVSLSRALGHSNIRQTMIYLKIVPVDIGKVLMKIDF